MRETPAVMIPGPGLGGDQSGDLDTGGPAGYANVVVFSPNSEKKYVAPSGGQYVSLQRGECEDRQHGVSLAGQAGVRRYQLDNHWAGDGVAVAGLKGVRAGVLGGTRQIVGARALRRLQAGRRGVIPPATRQSLRFDDPALS